MVDEGRGGVVAARASRAINNTSEPSLSIQTSLLSLPSTSALSKIIKAGYAVLQLEYFFTAGPDEVRAWTIRVRAALLWCTQTHTHI